MASILASGARAGLFRRARCAAPPSISLQPAAAALGSCAPARTVTHYYGNLEAHLKNSAGAAPKAADVPFVDQIRAEHLLKLRFHLGHHKRRLDKHMGGQLYGFRHNVAIFDIAKTWRSLRTVFYAFAEMAHLRSSFFLLAPNSSLPMQKLIERMRSQYPFKHNKFSSLYMLGYADHKYIDGTFSNWKQTYAFYEHVQRVLKANPNLKKFRRLQKYLRGVESVDLMGRIVPDFILVFATDRGALHEAANLDLPLMGMADSNVSPRPFLYPVFGNDDSVESVTFMMDLLGRAVEEGRKREHEAFAMCMVAKLKEKMQVQVASAADSADVFTGADDEEDVAEQRADFAILRERVAAQASLRRQPFAGDGQLPLDTEDAESTIRRGAALGAASSDGSDSDNASAATARPLR